MMKPLRSLLLAAVLLVGIMIGLGVTDQLEPFLKRILVEVRVLFPEPAKHSLVPVDFNPFADEDPCETNSPHELCI